eukprot:3901330-Rhodomonas_salina.1
MTHARRRTCNPVQATESKSFGAAFRGIRLDGEKRKPMHRMINQFSLGVPLRTMTTALLHAL